MVRIRCTHCLALFDAPDSVIGHKVECAKCKEWFEAQGDAPAPKIQRPSPRAGVVIESTAQTVKEEKPTEAWGKVVAEIKAATPEERTTDGWDEWVKDGGPIHLANAFSLIGGIVLLLCFLLTIESDPNTLAAAWHYVSLAGGALLVVWFVGRRLETRWPKMKRMIRAGVAITVCMTVIIWGWFDTYRTTWTSKTGATITDRYTRWGGRHYYRHLNIPVEGSSLGISTSGPMSASGKPHGEWEQFDWSKRGSDYHQRVWFWYGDEISEGEWHLRSR